MVPVSLLRALAFFEDVPRPHLEALAAAAEEVTGVPGTYIARQHGEARHVDVLLEGAVVFLMQFEGVADFLVGATEERGALIGWSTFRPPYRYTASVRCERATRVVRLPRGALEAVLTADPATGYMLMRRVVEAVAVRLEQTRDALFLESEDVLPDAHVAR